MKKGYDVFGPAYGVMLRNDLHALESIDHKFMREMILLEEESYDFLYGYSFYNKRPLDAYDLTRCKRYLEGYPEEYASLYSTAAINEYDPMGDNDYTVSLPNQYTIRIIETEHNGKWFMGEDKD